MTDIQIGNIYSTQIYLFSFHMLSFLKSGSVHGICKYFSSHKTATKLVHLTFCKYKNFCQISVSIKDLLKVKKKKRFIKSILLRVRQDGRRVLVFDSSLPTNLPK